MSWREEMRSMDPWDADAWRCFLMRNWDDVICYTERGKCCSFGFYSEIENMRWGRCQAQTKKRVMKALLDMSQGVDFSVESWCVWVRRNLRSRPRVRVGRVVLL